MKPQTTPLAALFTATAAPQKGSMSTLSTLAAPACIAAIPTSPDPAAKSSTRLPATSCGLSSTHRASACPPAQAKAQNGGGRPISPSSSSVSFQMGVTSSASHSEISGACGTGCSRVLAAMKAAGSGMVTGGGYTTFAGPGVCFSARGQCPLTTHSGRTAGRSF